VQGLYQIDAADIRAATGVDTAPRRAPDTAPKLIFLVTEDWYFWSHRLPVARAARDAGFAVVVATRVQEHGERIRNEGFRLEPLPWRRRGDGIAGAVRAIAAVAALYRREHPDIVHHVALKPVLFGGAAIRLAYPRRATRPPVVAAVAGLGSGFAPATGAARLKRAALGEAVARFAAGAHVIVQNPEDGAALGGFGVDRARIVLIRGSGIDTAYFGLLPDPPAPPVTVALVARMLRSKGVLDAVAAVRRLRERGMQIQLVLAGPTDPDNSDTLDEVTLAALTAEPGVEWAGNVADVRTVWRRAAIAVFPSTYGEGVPKALLEAASCGRPIVASDMPGCREIVRPGETGFLAPPHDVAGLAEGLARLAGDADLRRTMGAAARSLVEREFAEARVAEQTLALYDTALRGKPATPEATR
jgi:glycosyltransferase involved in cell wall biosynthesis